MKKRLAIIAGSLALGVCLASCSQSKGNDYSELRQAAVSSSSTVYAALGLADLENTATSSVLNSDVDKSKEYYEITTATDAVGSLVIYNVSIDEALKERGNRNKYFTVSCYDFSLSIYDEEKTAVTSVLYAEDKGVANLLSSLTADYLSVENTGWDKEYKTTSELFSAYEAKKNEDGVANTYLSIVYLPVKAEHYKVTVDSSSNTTQASCKLSTYILVPVYYAYTIHTGTTYSLIKADNENGYKLEESAKLATFDDVTSVLYTAGSTKDPSELESSSEESSN